MNMEAEMNLNAWKDFSMDAALLFILAKIDQYKGEKEFFENKYKRDFQVVEQEVHSVKGKEDFKLEEDLEDWEFAIKSLEYWEEEYIKVRNNAAVA
jgi:hypothetical protein